MDSANVDSSSIGARCAYCRAPWTQDDAVQCPECDTVSHRECWVENGGCPILSCAAAPKDEVIPTAGAGAWGNPSPVGASQSWAAAAARASTPAARLPSLNTSQEPPDSVDDSTHRRTGGPAGNPGVSVEPNTAGTAADGDPWWSAIATTADKSPENASWGASTSAAPQHAVPHQSATQQLAAPQTAPQPTAALPAAGWYPDPYSDHLLRWWDGQTWTEMTHPR